VATIVTVLGITGISAASPARPIRSAASASSVLGACSDADSEGSSVVLNINTDRTAQISNRCAGTWIVVKKTIAFDFDSSSCFGTEWVFTGPVSKNKLVGSGETTASGAPVSLTSSAVRIS
jgi:hypothetical protein